MCSSNVGSPTANPATAISVIAVIRIIHLFLIFIPFLYLFIICDAKV